MINTHKDKEKKPAVIFGKSILCKLQLLLKNVLNYHHHFENTWKID